MRTTTTRGSLLLALVLVAASCGDGPQQTNDAGPGGAGGNTGAAGSAGGAGSGGRGGSGGSAASDGGMMVDARDAAPDVPMPMDGGSDGGVTPDGGPDGGPRLSSCLDTPEELSRPPIDQLPCDLIPPGLTL